MVQVTEEGTSKGLKNFEHGTHTYLVVFKEKVFSDLAHEPLPASCSFMSLPFRFHGRARMGKVFLKAAPFDVVQGFGDRVVLVHRVSVVGSVELSQVLLFVFHY